MESFLSSFTNFFSITIRVVISILIARNISIEEMGKYQYYLSFIGFFQFITLPGMNTAITKGALKGYDPFLFTAIKKSFKVSILFSTSFIIIGYLIFLIKPDNIFFEAVLITSIFIPISSLQKFEPFIIGKKKFVQARTLVLVNTLIQLLIISITISITKNIYYLILSLFIINLINLFLQYIVCSYYYSASIKKEISVEDELNKMGMNFSYIQVFNQIVGKLDRLILGTLNPTYLATYHIGSLFPRTIKDNIKSMLSVPIIHWGSLDKKKNLEKIKKYGFYIFFMGICISLIIWFTSPFIITLFYGEKYFNSIIIVKFLSLSISFRLVSGLIEYENIFQSNGYFYTRQLVIIKSIYLLLLIFLIFKYSIMGAVYAILITDVLTFIINLIYLFKFSAKKS